MRESSSPGLKIPKKAKENKQARVALVTDSESQLDIRVDRMEGVNQMDRRRSSRGIRDLEEGVNALGP